MTVINFNTFIAVIYTIQPFKDFRHNRMTMWTHRLQIIFCLFLTRICRRESQMTFQGFHYKLQLHIKIFMSSLSRIKAILVIISCSQYSKLNFNPSPKSNQVFNPSKLKHDK